jgi:transposase-like protein
MGANMNEQEEADLKAMAAKLAEGVKSEKDLGDLTQKLVKLTVETALGAEMEAHLGYAKHDPVGRGSGNSRNGTTTKRLKGQHGDVELEAPRDRAGSFEPRFVRKGQTRQGFLDCIAACGTLLKEHVPATHERNELPNHLVILP